MTYTTCHCTLEPREIQVTEEGKKEKKKNHQKATKTHPWRNLQSN